MNDDNKKPGNEGKIEEDEASAKEWLWGKIRSPENPHHQQIVPYTAKWLISLPASIRPVQLTSQFPRIANLLAVAWNVPAQSREVLEGLIWDKRGNRKGFPPEVYQEIRVLYQHLLDKTGMQQSAPALPAVAEQGNDDQGRDQ